MKTITKIFSSLLLVFTINGVKAQLAPLVNINSYNGYSITCTTPTVNLYGAFNFTNSAVVNYYLNSPAIKP